MTCDMTIAFPLSGQGRPPQRDVFGAQYTARLYLCERFIQAIARRANTAEFDLVFPYSIEPSIQCLARSESAHNPVLA